VYTILVIYLFIMAKTTQVSDQFRTNELSLVPGGSRVTLFYNNGDSKVYDKVKNPNSYCSAVLKKSADTIFKIEVDGVLYFQKEKK
jgi:hypothetical protein